MVETDLQRLEYDVVPFVLQDVDMSCPPRHHVSWTPPRDIPARDATPRDIPIRGPTPSPVLHHRHASKGANPFQNPERRRAPSATPAPSRPRSTSAAPTHRSGLQNGDTIYKASDSDLTSLEGLEFDIPKPQGEAGRPNRGGYNLEDVLDWKQKDIDKFKVGATVSNNKPILTLPAGCYEEAYS